jgi:hypothetical protein
MTTDIVTACEVLRASGMKGCALLGLWLPFGRARRLEAAARKRCEVLEAKNLILDTLARLQKPLASLDLRTAKQAQEVIRDPEERKHVLGLGLNRAMLEDEADKYGLALGESFTQALAELVRARRVIRLTGAVDAPDSEIYLLVHLGARPRYDLSRLHKLLGRDEEYGDKLRARERVESERDAGRTYRINP